MPTVIRLLLVALEQPLITQASVSGHVLSVEFVPFFLVSAGCTEHVLPHVSIKEPLGDQVGIQAVPVGQADKSRHVVINEVLQRFCFLISW